MGSILFGDKAKCRTCGESSRFPVCKTCATKEELKIIKEVEEAYEKISVNRKRLLKCRLKLPKINPFFIFAFVLLWLYLAHSFLFSKFISEPIMIILITCLSVLFYIFSAFFWINFPQDNIKNGVEYMDLRHENLTLKRHKKYYLRLLKKPAKNWTKLETIKLNFETLEA